MTRLHPKRLLFTLLFLSIYACVHEESVTDVLSEKGLSVETAHSLHDAALAKVKTKTSAIQERVNMFYRESYQPVWEKALYSSTSEVESVDVPVDEQRKYYVTSLDGQWVSPG